MLVVRNDAHVVGADAGDPEPLLDTRMGLAGGVADELGRVARGVDVTARGPPAGGEPTLSAPMFEDLWWGFAPG